METHKDDVCFIYIYWNRPGSDRNNWFKFTAVEILSKGILYTLFMNNTTLFKNLQ